MNKGICEELHDDIHPLFEDAQAGTVWPAPLQPQLHGQIHSLNLENMIRTNLKPQRAPVPLLVEKLFASTTIYGKVLTERLSREFLK